MPQQTKQAMAHVVNVQNEPVDVKRKAKNLKSFNHSSPASNGHDKHF